MIIFNPEDEDKISVNIKLQYQFYINNADWFQIGVRSHNRFRVYNVRFKPMVVISYVDTYITGGHINNIPMYHKSVTNINELPYIYKKYEDSNTVITTPTFSSYMQDINSNIALNSLLDIDLYCLNKFLHGYMKSNSRWKVMKRLKTLVINDFADAFI